MLDAYLKRICHSGPLNADWATLAGLQRRHLATIPFEAMDVLDGRGVDVSLKAIIAKLVDGNRGGYCFEQNLLFEAVLKSIGFDVRRVMARVLWRYEDGSPLPPRTHLALIVRIEDVEWLVDVGFGGSVPDQPLRLVTDEVQETRHDRFQLRTGREGLALWMYRDGAWQSGYELTPGNVEDADVTVANWYTSTNPNSGFRKALSLALCTENGRHGLYERQLSIRRPFEAAEMRELQEAEIDAVLRDYFNLPLGRSGALGTT